jgi:chromosomal replication initiation ATPase DnaA
MQDPTGIACIAPPSLVSAVNNLRETNPDDGPAYDRLLDYLQQNQPKMQEIKAAICELYGFSLIELLGRSVETTLARQIFCYFAFKYTRNSAQRVGYEVGLMDHATVLSAIRKIEKQEITMALVRDDVDLLRMRISEKVMARRAVRC